MNKIYQPEELYIKQNGKYRWVTKPELAYKLWGANWELLRRDYINDNELRSNMGLPITEWPEVVPEQNHKTDKLYKLLYVCPSADINDMSWVDEAREVGFNVVHTYSTDKYPWEDALDIWLDELANRDMYGCLQLPHKYIDNFIEGMSGHPNAILSSVEEPDGAEGRTSKEEQKRIYDIAHSKGVPVWGCLDWGLWKERVNFEAFDLIVTDSYMYSKWDGSMPVPGTAAEGGNKTEEWWSISHKVYDKIKLIKDVTPPNMPVINIQQGFYLPEGENVYPNIEEEWLIYNKELGLNSFGAYPHGYGQGFPSVMNDERLKLQCKNLMKKLDEGLL